jgi:hypothetical protein
MDNRKYIGMDVHQASISIAVIDAAGKLLMDASSKRRQPLFWNSSREYVAAYGSPSRKEPVPPSLLHLKCLYISGFCG